MFLIFVSIHYGKQSLKKVNTSVHILFTQRRIQNSVVVPLHFTSYAVSLQYGNVGENSSYSGQVPQTGSFELPIG
jgi:hypothetical protein